jgi:hypothetical protein
MPRPSGWRQNDLARFVVSKSLFHSRAIGTPGDGFTHGFFAGRCPFNTKNIDGIGNCGPPAPLPAASGRR